VRVEPLDDGDIESFFVRRSTSTSTPAVLRQDCGRPARQGTSGVELKVVAK
jgi:hypothetical protein